MCVSTRALLLACKAGKPCVCVETHTSITVARTGANNREKRVFVALSFHATYTFHSDTGADYMACRQRLRTAFLMMSFLDAEGVWQGNSMLKQSGS